MKISIFTFFCDHENGQVQNSFTFRTSMNRLTLNSQITVTLFTELFCVDFDFIFEIQFSYENFSYT